MITLFKAFAISLFLLAFLVAILTNKKETKKSSVVTLIVLGVIICVL